MSVCLSIYPHNLPFTIGFQRIGIPFFWGTPKNKIMRKTNTLKKEKLISILIPIHNAQPFLAECLESVLCQTYRHLEIICIDDGSTDNSPSILRSYAKKDERLRVFYQKNQGAAYTRNRLLSKIRGAYFAFVDADDKIAPNYLEELYQAAVAYNSDVVRSLYLLEDASTGRQTLCEEVYHEFNRPVPSSCPVERIQAALDDTQVWLKLIKTSLVKEKHLQFLNYALAEDSSFEIQLYLYANKITFLNRHLYYYRVGNPHSASSDKRAWAAGTLENMCFVCRELQKKQFRHRKAWNQLGYLVLHAIRRMRKFPMGTREVKLCQQGVATLRSLLPYCGKYTRLKFAFFIFSCAHVSPAKIPYIAWGFR